MRKFISVTNLLFLAIVVLEFAVPPGPDGSTAYFIGLVIVLQAVYIMKAVFSKTEESRRTAGDIVSVLYILLFAWELATGKLRLLDQMLFPAPGAIISLFFAEIPQLLKGLSSSLGLLASGYLLALAASIPLAILIGWRQRLYRAVKPFTKFLGPIPPIVYIPYAIALLPTFRAASTFIIFIGAFWPVFINTLNGVFSIDKRIIDSARALNVRERDMLTGVILPGTLPSIISGANIGLVLSFILLTAAEMIGATSGLGWYVKYFSDFADYSKVIVGILYIGLVVLGITYCFDRLERYLLRWKK